jgi:hypothetical protein
LVRALGLAQAPGAVRSVVSSSKTVCAENAVRIDQVTKSLTSDTMDQYSGLRPAGRLRKANRGTIIQE